MKWKERQLIWCEEELVCMEELLKLRHDTSNGMGNTNL